VLLGGHDGTEDSDPTFAERGKAKASLRIWKGGELARATISGLKPTWSGMQGDGPEWRGQRFSLGTTCGSPAGAQVKGEASYSLQNSTNSCAGLVQWPALEQAEDRQRAAETLFRALDRHGDRRLALYSLLEALATLPAATVRADTGCRLTLRLAINN